MKSYISATLLPEEKLLYYTKPHFIIFTYCLLWFFLSVVIIIFGEPIGWNFYNIDVPKVMSYAFFFIGVYSIISAYFTYIASEYGITDKRVLMKVGLIRRNSLEIILQKIESIHVEQSILGRILDYGTIIICGTGGSKDYFYYIPKPLQFRRVAQEQVESTLLTSRHPPA